MAMTISLLTLQPDSDSSVTGASSSATSEVKGTAQVTEYEEARTVTGGHRLTPCRCEHQAAILPIEDLICLPCRALHRKTGMKLLVVQVNADRVWANIRQCGNKLGLVGSFGGVKLNGVV